MRNVGQTPDRLTVVVRNFTAAWEIQTNRASWPWQRSYRGNAQRPASEEIRRSGRRSCHHSLLHTLPGQNARTMFTMSDATARPAPGRS